MTLKYIIACILGHLLGWFGYDILKGAFTAIKRGRRTRDAAVEASRSPKTARPGIACGAPQASASFGGSLA